MREVQEAFSEGRIAMAKILERRPLGLSPEDNEVAHVRKMVESLRRGVKNVHSDAMDEWMRAELCGDEDLKLKALDLAAYAGKRYAEFQNYARHLETLHVD